MAEVVISTEATERLPAAIASEIAEGRNRQGRNKVEKHGWKPLEEEENRVPTLQAWTSSSW